MLQHNQDAVSGTLSDATPVSVDMRGAALPATVVVKPTNGDTVSVEFTFDGTNWVAWPSGTVSATTVDTIDAPVIKLRFTRASGSGTTSTFYVL